MSQRKVSIENYLYKTDTSIRRTLLLVPRDVRLKKFHCNELERKRMDGGITIRRFRGSLAYEWNTVKPLKTDTPRDEQKCPSYRGVRLIEVIFNRNLPLGHR